MEYVLILIFTALGLLHFYWVFGGTGGLKNAVPNKGDGQAVFKPGKLATSVVGLGLLSFAAYYVQHLGYFEIPALNAVFYYLGWIIPAIFLLRAIGDFKYAGFFKQIKDTGFARMDTKFYAPLCLFIAILGYLVQLI